MTAKNKKRSREAMRKKRNTKLRVTMVIFTLCMFFLTGQIFHIKAEYGDVYERKAIEQHVSKNGVNQYINPNRGMIVDRNRSLQALAISTTVYNVVWDIRLMVKEKDEVIADTIDKLNRVLEIPKETLYEYIAIDPETKLPVNDRNYFVLVKKIDAKTKNMLVEEGPVHVWFEEDTDRKYPNGSLAASLIGFVGGNNSNWGLEAQYNQDLTGVQGRIVRMYDQNNNVVTEKVNPTQGHTVVTTIDLFMQQQAQEITERYGKLSSAEHTALIAMNPKTGEILAMAQYPTFDLNDPRSIEGINDETLIAKMAEMDDNERMDEFYGLWANYCVSSTFEPGSIYKPLVVAAALEEGVIKPDDTFFCGGEKIIYDKGIPCWNLNGHGHLNVTDILAKSCNVGMMDIIEKLGKEKYYEYQKGFGVGELTGIDLIGERDNERWVHNLASLGPVEFNVAAMGQGFTMTGIQCINAFAAVINGGNIMKPYVVSQIVDSDNNIVEEFEPQIQRKVISQDVSDWVRVAMKRTISEEGTGKNAIIEGYSIGGKTATAQQGVKGEDDDEYTLSFMAYFPAEDPEYLIMSVINKPAIYRDGSANTIPMVKDLITSIIQHNHIQPYNDEGSMEDLLYDNITRIEDYSGQKIADVTRSLNFLKLDYEISGQGNIVSSHRPVGGTQVSEGSKIFIILEDDGEDDLSLVPSIVGMTKAQAEETVINAGFIPVFANIDQLLVEENDSSAVETNEDERDDDLSAESIAAIVSLQMPQDGLMLQTGTEIKLYLEKINN